jgi:hypothetical protein
VRDKHSPLRRYLDRRFPNARPIQADFRGRAGALHVRSGGADPSVLGAAFDFEVRFLLKPTHTPIVAMLGFAGQPDTLALIESIADAAREAARDPPLQADQLSRACWALALCTDVYRGGLLPGSSLDRLITAGRFTRTGLLSLAPADALRQLSELRAIAECNLLPHLAHPVHVGPVFDGSALCNADADLICGGLLLDIKTHLGRKNPRTDVRSDSLALIDLYQLVAYALFDRSDAYRISSIGIYSARYGTLATWPLIDALQILSDSEIDLARERETVWRLLGGRPGGSVLDGSGVSAPGGGAE